MHEASLWDHNIFLTLTYDDLHLPNDGHLEARALQLFLKRLRSSVSRDSGAHKSDHRTNLRYFAAGEYGGDTHRPHYHAILFNYEPSDAERVGQDLYTSPILDTLWTAGHNRFGQVTAASAAYVAQYNIKPSSDHDENGVWRPPPFLRMSLRPAIGKNWLDKYQTDLQHGYLINETRKNGIPRYYLKKIKENNRELYDALRQKQHEQRSIRATVATQKQIQEAISPERLNARETIHIRRKQLTTHRT